MQPNEPAQYSIDYLDQIAVPTQRSGKSDKLFFIVIILGILVAITVGVLALMGGGNTTKDTMRLAARLKTLQSITESSSKTIKSSSLRGTNSSLALLLTNVNHDIVEPLAKSDINASKLDKTIVASEDGSKLKEQLENARLNVAFDRTYAREMSYQLETLLALMKDINANTNNKSLKEFLSTNIEKIDPLRQRFSEFNATTD